MVFDNEMMLILELKGEDGSEVEDGEVDVQIERMRVRKIMIKVEKFLELEKGKIVIILKDKEGEFVLKFLNINYEFDEVEVVFFVKDFICEKMVLVCQKINWGFNIVVLDLKVNNRIVIQ